MKTQKMYHIQGFLQDILLGKERIDGGSWGSGCMVASGGLGVWLLLVASEAPEGLYM